MLWKISLVLQAASINVKAKTLFFISVSINEFHDEKIITYFQDFAAKWKKFLCNVLD